MPNQPFRIGINMAGAVSAGAYTAGVLDFLMEALEQWQAAKDRFKNYLNDSAAGPVPPVASLHDVMIEVFSGASAGGMCAAIAAVMVQQRFEHIQTGDEQNTTNTFYESWVNRIDIHELLKTTDISGGSPLLSLLDSSIIDSIAEYALTPSAPQTRPYIANDLTLFLCLTNARGTPYHLYNDPTPTIEEFTAYYGDRLRFEATVGSSVPMAPTAKPLPAGQPREGAWNLLKQAAKATGAVPVALASKMIERDVADYEFPCWKSLCDSSTLPRPSFPTGVTTLQTLNIDGGVTDNSPFALADQYLVGRNPLAQNCNNPSAPEAANAAVLTVAPFPMQEMFDAAYNPSDHQGIWSILASTFNITLSQSRFLGEDLAGLMNGTSFSRFVIAPSDPQQQDKQALQCGTLGAFGGFFSSNFRKHDFLLGRRNCQQFLKVHFCLPKSNPVITAGLAKAGPYGAQIQAQFCVEPPGANTGVPQATFWIPVIPLCGTAISEVPEPIRTQIPESDLEEIVDRITDRLNVVRTQLVPGMLGGLVSNALWFLLNVWIVKGEAQGLN